MERKLKNNGKIESRGSRLLGPASETAGQPAICQRQVREGVTMGGTNWKCNCSVENYLIICN